MGGVECRVGGGECTLCGGLEASNRLRNNGTRFRLRHLSRLQKKRAGGPDGWAGSELAALPFAMSDLTEIFSNLGEHRLPSDGLESYYPGYDS